MESAGIPALAMACQDATCDFKPISFERRAVGPKDVLIEMKYCGVCHSDLHTAANHWSMLASTRYPCVPGHELAGICKQVGDQVTKIKVGDQIGVGCMVDSCLECEPCLGGEEQFCKKEMVGTYNGKSEKFGRADTLPAGQQTFGGYSTQMVVHEHFAIKIPEGYKLEAAGPVMCAGITMYDPLKRYGATKGSRVGVVGLGGLGVMGMKLAKALGCSVTAISTSESKKELATKSGADCFVVSKSSEVMKANAGTLDLILNTIPTNHDYHQYVPLLAENGKQVFLGIHSGFAAALLTKDCTMCCGPAVHHASIIGGIQNTQEVIDICAKENIVPEYKVVPVHEINYVYEQLDSSNDTGLRYVLDIGTLNEGTAAKCTLPPPKLQPPNSLSMCGLFGNMCSQLMGRVVCCCMNREK